MEADDAPPRGRGHSGRAPPARRGGGGVRRRWEQAHADLQAALHEPGLEAGL